MKIRKTFRENHIDKGLAVKIQLKENAKLIQQKGTPIPIHKQHLLEKERKKSKKKRNKATLRRQKTSSASLVRPKSR